jgi:hypothetical protein
MLVHRPGRVFFWTPEPLGETRALRTRVEASILGRFMNRQASAGLFCELYWGTSLAEAWSFGPEQPRVLAAPDEKAPLPLYGFTLPANYQVTLKTTGVAGEDLSLSLIKDANNNGVAEASDVIGTSLAGVTNNETIFKSSLSAGTYFLQVKRVSGSPGYKLLVKTDYAGNSFFNARNLGSFTGTKTFKDRVDDADDNADFYKVVLTSTKTLSANLSGTGDAHLELSKDFDNDGVYDDGQDFIHRSNNPGTSNEAFTFTLGPGTYFVRVFRGAADAQYALNVKVA